MYHNNDLRQVETFIFTLKISALFKGVITH